LADSSPDEVRAKLIATATELYGARGTHAVSAREIQRAAGVLNEAAVRYYFGDKLGLLSACLQLVAQQYAAIADEFWDELDHKKRVQGMSVIDVIGALVLSFHALQMANAGGVQLVARLIREEGEAGQALLLQNFDVVIWRLENELRELLPGKSAAALRLHVFLAINSTVNGMVDQSLLWSLPAVESSEGNYHLPPEKLARGFIEYVAAGVSASSSL
jgi:AcrR family transcriptional regulator